jgi:DNA invertase Pin-like site-specific DNA recombinase
MKSKQNAAQAKEQSVQSRRAIAYLRTSSATNVGAEKDSDKGQRAAIESFAKRERLEIVQEFYDADVSGAEPIETRPGFSAC